MASHCAGVHIYSKLRSLPHKVNDRLHHPELCSLVGFFLVTIFQVHSLVRLQGSCHLFSAASTHIPSLVSVFLYQLVVSAASSLGYSSNDAATGRSWVGGASTMMDDMWVWTTCLCSLLVPLPLFIFNPKSTAFILQWIAVRPVITTPLWCCDPNKTLLMMDKSGYKINQWPMDRCCISIKTQKHVRSDLLNGIELCAADGMAQLWSPRGLWCEFPVETCHNSIWHIFPP